MPSPEALFRYAILSQVEALVLGGTRVGEAVRAVAARTHADLEGRALRVSARTIQRWRAAYATRGMAGLEPRSRQRTETSELLPEALILFLRAEKEHDPCASVPELIRRARVKGIASGPLDRIAPLRGAYVWRACQRMGLPTRIRPGKKEGDRRRWRYAHRMQCVLCDGKHFRAGAGRLRRVALFFLDDATRYAITAIVGTSESSDLFLRGLYDMVRYAGLPELLYLDHGPGFIARDTRTIVQEGLGAWLIHGTAHYPQGRGVVERFNRTAQEQLLRSLDGAIEVDPAPEALTLRLRHYLARYNSAPHEGLTGKSPREAWEAGRPLRMPESEATLRAAFVVRETRLVSEDHVIQHGGRLWEAPRGLAGQTVEVIRHVLDGHLRVLHQGRLVRLAELNPHANAAGRRGLSSPPVAGEGIPTTAAREAFDRDNGPITGPDGGFADPQSSNESDS
jgi:hypothetical protein